MNRRVIVSCVSAMILLGASQAFGQATWGGGDGDWTGANWTGGSGPGGAPAAGNTINLPSGTGNVNITTNLASDVGTFGALTISGGELNVVSTGQFQASGDQRVNGVLNIRGGFQSDGGLDVLREGAGVGVLNIGGNAEVLVGANLDTWWDAGAILEITGADARIEVGGTFFLGTDARMITNINSDTFSTIDVFGNVNFPGGNGTLEVNFVDGYEPTLGSSWVLFDSPTVGGAIPVLDLPDVGAGEFLTVNYGEGGENGQIVTLDFLTTLNLQVNTVTGDVAIDNPAAGAADLEIDGYLIRSSSGALVDTAFTGIGQPGWLAGLQPSQSNRLLTETNLRASSVVGSDQSYGLGNIFNTAGEQDLVFEIHVAGLGTLPGTVQYFGVVSGGDYNGDGAVDVLDIDLQSSAIKDPAPDLATFDENGDGAVDFADREIWVNDHKNTYMGDSNLDGEFNSGDLVAVFTAGKYNTGEMAGWADGDWSGDMVFDSGDLVAAFQAGGYELGPRPAVAAVPEPGSLVLWSVAAVGLALRSRKRGRLA